MLAIVIFANALCFGSINQGPHDRTRAKFYSAIHFLVLGLAYVMTLPLAT